MLHVHAHVVLLPFMQRLRRVDITGVSLAHKKKLLEWQLEEV